MVTKFGPLRRHPHQHQGFSTAKMIRVSRLLSLSLVTVSNTPYFFIGFIFAKTILGTKKKFTAKETLYLNPSTTSNPFPIIPRNFPSLSCLATELSLAWLTARFLSSFLVSRKNLETAQGDLLIMRWSSTLAWLLFSARLAVTSHCTLPIGGISSKATCLCGGRRETLAEKSG